MDEQEWPIEDCQTYMGAADTRNADATQRSRARNKVCLICGDRAFSCNFGATTCESCKAFFRRHASKNFSTKCDGKCVVSFQTRAHCRACRLQKCYNVGMRQERILTEEQKQRRLMKIKDNRTKRQQTASHSSHHGSDNGEPKQSAANEDWESSMPNYNLVHSGHVSQESNSSHRNTLDCKDLASEFHLKNNVDGFKQDPYSTFQHRQEVQPSSSIEDGACSDVSPDSSSLKSSEENSPLIKNYDCSLLSSLAADQLVGEFNPLFKVDFSSDIFSAMAAQEVNMLVEVFRAFDVSYNKPNSLENPGNFTEFFNMARFAIRQLVKMAKNIHPFKSLVQSDQVELLKTWVLEVMVIKSVKTYDTQRDMWFILGKSGGVTTVSTHLIKNTSPETANFWSTYLKVVASINKFTQKDDLVLMLVTLITLFSTPPTSLVDQKKVSGVRLQYMALLRSYWFAKYHEPSDDLPERVDRLLLEVKRDLGNISALILSTNVADLEPLLLEMFSVNLL
ncbi:hypothetical protein CAPTEDRAFT_220526 [Capitella teleta]|uniref:Nuclear receptor domain-containing protein n=1 Tax=Capitella teleta TaxID=283909 RepID=R7TU03_CAPTE|nr:hypothetical protein CAPTEDRAFT_220526 [Capitella teleta]|eukprot:ELT97373.1 hypothetical protein CAPTEDRAFT_220526 [Capitella teleta]